MIVKILKPGDIKNDHELMAASRQASAPAHLTQIAKELFP